MVVSVDRYEIASGRGDLPIAYKFKQTANADTVFKYMGVCMKDDVMLDASTLTSNAIEEAAIRMCKHVGGVSYVVATKKEADLLPMVYGYRKIYTVDGLPDNCRTVICGEGVNPAHLGSRAEILLGIINKAIDKTD